MHVRRTLTALLIVMFLSLSSMASACDVKCALAQGAPACHDSRAVSPAMPPMAGMTSEHVCCDRAFSVITAHSCSHQVCASQAAIAGESFRLDAHFATVAAVIHADTGRFAHLATLVLIPVRGPQLCRGSLPFLCTPPSSSNQRSSRHDISMSPAGVHRCL